MFSALTDGCFSTQSLGEARVIEVVGEIDISNVHEFDGELERAADSNCSTIVVSFERATYIDSTTVNALLKSADRFRARGQCLAVAVPKENQCSRIFRLIGVDKLLPVRDSVNEAALAGKNLFRASV